jgi:hypothetical protein
MKSIDNGDFIEQIDWRLLNKLEEIIFNIELLSKEDLDRKIETSEIKLAKNLIESWDMNDIMKNYLYYRFNWSMTIQEKIFPLQRITWFILRYYIEEKELSQDEVDSLIIEALEGCSITTIHGIEYYMEYSESYKESSKSISNLANESYWKVIDILSWNNNK